MEQFNNRTIKNSGFTLIEVMIAIFVTIVGVVGIYSLVPHIFGVAAVNNDRFIASQLAKEGIEIIRNIRDVNYLESIDDVTISWNEGLDGCTAILGGCEVDYNLLDEETPSLQLWTATGGRDLYVGANGFFNYIASPKNSNFQRKIIIDPCSSDPIECIDVRIEVYWPKNTYFSNEITSLQVAEKLYNWR